MSRAIVWLSVGWLTVAILLAIGSTAGGDASIVTGFLWLAWTAPFGMMWQLWVYDSVLPFLGTTASNWVGIVVGLVGAYLFWFVGIPRMFRAARRRAKPS